MSLQAKLLKKAYGYEVEGKVEDTEQKNIQDTAQPAGGHTTTQNPANVSLDSQAEQEFPELEGRRRQHTFPARNRK